MEDTDRPSWFSTAFKKFRGSKRPKFQTLTNAPVHYDWRIIGQSVRGASHLRSGLPNQDAIGWDPQSGSGSELIVAVSDGHGSAKYFRSDIGSMFAVKAALSECRNLISGQPDFNNLSAIKRTAEERVPQLIVRHWERLVQEHIAANPITVEELDQAVAKATSPIDRNFLDVNPMLCYGATVLAALVTNTFALFFRLGDGDILTVFEGEEVSRPIAKPSAADSIGDDTRSLCLPNAWRDFEFAFQALSGTTPALVLVTSDGYPKSFAEDAGFLKLGSDLFELILGEGLELVNANLDTWLNDASQQASGDDISLGLIYRGPQTPSPTESRSKLEKQTGEN